VGARLTLAHEASKARSSSGKPDGVRGKRAVGKPARPKNKKNHPPTNPDVLPDYFCRKFQLIKNGNNKI
jgi:hypothetical protein